MEWLQLGTICEENSSLALLLELFVVVWQTSAYVILEDHFRVSCNLAIIRRVVDRQTVNLVKRPELTKL